VFSVVWKLTSFNSTGLENHIQIINRYDPLFFFFIGAQVLTAVLGCICRSVQIYSNLMGSDRSFLAMGGVRVFFISFSAAVNCVLIDRVKNIAKSSKAPFKASPVRSE
jgi:hypothetical protein